METWKEAIVVGCLFMNGVSILILQGRINILVENIRPLVQGVASCV